MRLHSLLPLGLMLSSLGSCRPGAGARPETVGLKSTFTTDVSHPEYLGSHGYSVRSNPDGIYWILSEFFHGPGPVVKISVDSDHKAVTILDNYLDQGMVNVERLKLPQIFQGFCYETNIPCNEMKSITMDIEDSFTHRSATRYRQGNGLGLDQEFEIAANQPGWEVFSPTIYYRHTTEMLPGVEAEKITIKQQKRTSPTPRYAAVVAEVMMVSFRQSEPKSE